MISPLEIQEKEFSRGLKGFKEEEVNEFLDQITLDLERLLEENRQLKAEKEQLTEEVRKYQNSENSVLETLETAKALMGDISASAEKRAQILLKNAELDAQRVQREAKEAVERMNEENAAMRGRLSSFRTKYRQLLESELQRFDTLSAELFPELGIEELSELPESKAKARPQARQANDTRPQRSRSQDTRAQKARPSRSADDRKKTMVHIK
ncbi:DivIVA domain-containing protein [bacterium 210820-DFI.6.37]|nr:DivIVA domain-containing protein [bacterium 210820-DFI.6.37]